MTRDLSHNGFVPSATNPEALRADIRQLRTELGETVQALAAKADVKARVRESAGQARQRARMRAAHTTEVVRDRAHEAELAARRGPWPWLALAAVGVTAAVVWLVISRNRA